MFADKYGAKYDKAVACLTEGSGSATRLLQLPRRALGPSACIKPDRECVRDGASSHRADKGRAIGKDRQIYGV